jgi:4-amino-4-deoxy-L-arabinose transferase-like glycosyltransferase
MANTQRDGGSNTAIVAIFAIVVIVLLLGFLFLVHPFGFFSTGSSTTQTTASPSVAASVAASASKSP